LKFLGKRQYINLPGLRMDCRCMHLCLDDQLTVNLVCMARRRLDLVSQGQQERRGEERRGEETLTRRACCLHHPDQTGSSSSGRRAWQAAATVLGRRPSTLNLGPSNKAHLAATRMGRRRARTDAGPPRVPGGWAHKVWKRSRLRVRPAECTCEL